MIDVEFWNQVRKNWTKPYEHIVFPTLRPDEWPTLDGENESLEDYLNRMGELADI
jgi:hypothetical protein